MASCWVISGLVLLALSFIACAISLVAPYWMVIQGADSSLFSAITDLIQLGGTRLQTTNYGLWAECVQNNAECKWFFQNEFEWEHDRPVWWKASQGLFAFGVLLILIAFLTACVYLCSACCKAFFSIVHFINGLLVFAFIALAVSLSLFGAKVHELERVGYDPSKTRYFYWGYWVGCGGALLDLLAVLFYSCEGCRGGSPAGYSRGEVV